MLLVGLQEGHLACIARFTFMISAHTDHAAITALIIISYTCCVAIGCIQLVPNDNIQCNSKISLHHAAVHRNIFLNLINHSSSSAWIYTQCANKKQSGRKNCVFQQQQHGFEPNFQTVSIHTTHPANCIETTDMVQQIFNKHSNLKFKVHFIEYTR